MSIIIDKNISDYLVDDDAAISEVLKKIDSNKDGMVICVDHYGLLLGVFTDGDFRRIAIDRADLSLSAQIKSFINKDCIVARINDNTDKISSLINNHIRFIPLVDSLGRCVALARRRTDYLAIGNHKIGLNNPCFIIAEIGNNHNGSYDLARRLVDEAVNAKADCAKFQMRDMQVLYANKGNTSDLSEDLGSQYTLDLLSRFQLTKDDMFRIFDYCDSKGILPLCTAWDESSVDALEGYGILAYKTASADLTNHDLLSKIAKTGKPIICSTGMSLDSEIKESTSLLKDLGAQFALLQCNSTYPAPFKDINLAHMEKLRKFGECPVGYSSHDRGINVSIAAVALGANIIEKHFTLDRGMEGNDHRVSLLPKEFSELVVGIRQVEEAIGADEPRRISQGELMNRESLGKSLFVNEFIKTGQAIENQMIEVRSPGRGLQPNKKKMIVGSLAKRDLKPGDILTDFDLSGQLVLARDYKFKRPFGIPIRYHDLASLSSQSNFDLLEFHLSYKDMEEDESKFFKHQLNMGFVVHAPELFKNDHILDLCSPNVAYREISINHLRAVIHTTKKLKSWFTREKKPRIVVNVGAFTQDNTLNECERKDRYEILADSLKQVELDGIEILPQTMPPFPWHFGGQRYQNLFVHPEEIAQFCKTNNMNICFDISHSKLACNHFKWSITEYIDFIAPYISHMHIADASGIDGEGLQIGEGDIDFHSVCYQLMAKSPDASFIPEIWQGHKNNGEGFWRALELLEKNF